MMGFSTTLVKPIWVWFAACDFQSNRGPGGGGGLAISDGHAVTTARGCTFASNRSPEKGGALFIQSKGNTLATTVSGCTFAFNRVMWGKGAAIAAGYMSHRRRRGIPEGSHPSGGQLAVSHCVFWGNTVDNRVGGHKGSAISTVGTNLTLENVHVVLDEDSLVSSHVWLNAVESVKPAACMDEIGTTLLEHMPAIQEAVRDAAVAQTPPEEALRVCMLAMTADVLVPFACFATVGQACHVFAAADCTNGTFLHDARQPALCSENGTFPFPRPGCAACAASDGQSCGCAPGERLVKNVTDVSLSCRPCRPLAGFDCPGGTTAERPCSNTSGVYCPNAASGAQAAPCPAGSYCPSAATKTACPAGRYSGNVTGALTFEAACHLECPAGFSSTAGSSECAACNETDTFCAGGQAKQTVAAGFYATRNHDGIRVGQAVCPDSTFCVAGARHNCSLCDAGKFLKSSCTPQHDAQCEACPEGAIPADDLQSCVFCTPGRFLNKSMSACKNCSGCKPGTFVMTPCGGLADATCVSCAPGAVQPRAEQFSCATCASGRYQVEQTCVECPRGHAQEAQGSSLCKACGHTSVQPTGGSASCVACALGTYKVEQTCVGCPRGHARAVPALATCDPCKAQAKVQPETGKAACDSCVGKRVAGARGVRCVCRDGTYDDSMRKDTVQNDCAVCPVGGLCCESVFGAGVVRLNTGYWRPPTFRGRLFACLVRDACPGVDQDACPEKEANTTALDLDVGSGDRNMSSTMENTMACRPGHVGPGCGICVSDFKPNAAGLCVACGAEGASSRSATQTSLFVLGTLLLVLVRAAYEIRFGAAELKNAKQLQTADAYASEAASQGTILLPLLQRMGALDTALPKVPLPMVPKAIIDTCKIFYANLARLFVTISPCNLHVSFGTNLALAMGVAPWLMMILGLANGIVVAVNRRKPHWHGAETRARLLGNALYGFKFVHPFISQVCLRVLLCTELGDDQFFLADDVSIECSYANPRYLSLFLTSLAGVVVWVVGIPGLLFWAVVRDRRRLARDAESRKTEDGRRTRQLLHAATAAEKAALRIGHIKAQYVRSLHDKLHKSVTPFTDETKPEYYYLFVIDMFISFMLIAFLGVLARSYAELQITLSLIMGVVQLVLPASLQPYKCKSSTRLAVGGAVVYGAMQLAALTKYFAMTSTQAQASADSVAAAEALRARLSMIDGVLSVVFITGAACLFLTALPSLVASLQKVVLSLFGMEGRRKGARVVPSSRKKRSRRKKKTEPATPPTKSFDAMPNSISRPSAQVLARLPAETLEAYIEAYRALYNIHTHVVVVGVQAAVRGKTARAKMVRLRQASVRAAWGSEESRAAVHGREAELERKLAEERKHEAELEKELAEERRKEQQLETQLSSMKLRIVDKHLEKAADEAEAKRILSDHFEEHAERQQQLEQERRRSVRASQKRHKKRRFKHVLSALNAELAGAAADEIRTLVDVNGDGEVSLQELWGVLEKLTLASGHAMTKEDAEAVLKEVDVSGDEMVTVDELIRGVRAGESR